jgi:transcriptional regulator, TetR family
MPRKNDPKGTVEKIVAVSSELFAQKGYEKTSMQDIVDALGMSKGAIFHHFKSKEEIFRAVIDKQSEYIKRQLQIWIEEMEGFTAREKLIGILNRNLHDFQAHALDSVLTAQAQSSQFVLSSIQESMNKAAPVIADIMREGQADGTITTDFPDECAELLLLLINMWCDPAVFTCDISRLTMRFRCLQRLMANMGVDVISDELLSECIELVHKLYNKGGE